MDNSGVMDISTYIENICDAFNVDIEVVNNKNSLKETLNTNFTSIMQGILENKFDDVSVQFTERDMRIAQFAVIRVISQLCLERGRF